MRKALFVLLILFSIKCYAKPVIFNLLPKSGSIFIGKTLSDGLKKGRVMTISNNTFLSDRMFCDSLKLLILTESLTQEYFDAFEGNFLILKEKLPKLIVHVRDSKQSIISWTHHLNKIQPSQEALDHFLLLPPNELFKKFNWKP